MNKTVSEGHVVTGVLGKEFAYGSAVKIVIIELLDMEECFEIAQVYGENEDFVVVCSFPLNMPARYGKKGVSNYLRTFNDLPVYTCKISHNLDMMSKEEAFGKILNAAEPWEMDTACEEQDPENLSLQGRRMLNRAPLVKKAVMEHAGD